MLISALNDYYNVLAEKDKQEQQSLYKYQRVAIDGYDLEEISYLVFLSEKGEISNIANVEFVDEASSKGNKTIYKPRIQKFPRRVSKSGINSELIEHRYGYIFGLAEKNKLSKKSKEQHESFVKLHLKFFEGLVHPLSVAFKKFVENWDIESASAILDKWNCDDKKSYAFCLEGHPELMLQDIPEVNQKWLQDYNVQKEKSTITGKCAICGEDLKIADTHTKVRFSQGLQSGSTFVSFKADSSCSYGKEKSYNANISERVMEHYTKALKFLVRSSVNYTLLDDITLIYWAANGDERCDEMFDMLTVSDKLDADDVGKALQSFADGLKNGVNNLDEKEFTEKLDPNVMFYIVAIKPNSSRLAVKYFYRQSFGKVMENIVQHQKDLQIGKSNGRITLDQIKKELIPPKSSNQNIDPSGMMKIFEAVVNGTNYPDFLLNSIIRRVKTDNDDKKIVMKKRITALK